MFFFCFVYFLLLFFGGFNLCHVIVCVCVGFQFEFSFIVFVFGSICWPLLGFLEDSKRRRGFWVQNFMRERVCRRLIVIGRGDL